MASIKFQALGKRPGCFAASFEKAGINMPCLVIQLARMGDLLQTKRLLFSLAQTDAVHLLVDRSLTGLAELVFPFATVHGIAAHGGGNTADDVLDAVLFDLAGLGEFDFGTVYNLNYSGLNLALSRLWNPDKLRGYWLDSGQQMRSSWLNLAFRWSAERRTAPLNLMDLWGMLAPSPIAPNRVNPRAEAKGGGLGVVLAGRMARRSIPPELWAVHIAAVSQRMARQAGERSGRGMEYPNVYLFGGNSEQNLAKEVMLALPAQVSGKTVNLAGKTSLPELAGKISGLDRLLTPDTGGMHLAAHFGTPVEAFFLASAWADETGPYGEGHTVWQALTPCLPCLESQPCPFDIKCLNVFNDSKFLKILSRPEYFTSPYAPVSGSAGSEKAESRESAAAPEGILGLKSGFDELGVVYDSFLHTAPQTRAISSPDGLRRMGLRKLVAEYSCEKLMNPLEAGAIDIRGDNQIYEYFFRENDWMLPKKG